MSYCIDMPSLVRGLVLRDKMRADALGGNRTGLPVSSAESIVYMPRVGGVRGTTKGDDPVDAAVAVARASTKGAPRGLGAASWERLRASKSVEEVCADRAWDGASPGSLLAVVAVPPAADCGRE
jgi:hypothetical protein